MALSRSLAETLRIALSARGAELHTAFPGTIISYDSASQTADVRPGTMRVGSPMEPSGDETREELPTLPRVPVAWPRAGSFYLHGELAEGDGVLVVCCEAQIDAWLAGAEAGDPGTPERHGLAGAVAIPGLSPNGSRIGDASQHPAIGIDGAEQIQWVSSQIRVGGDKPLAIAAALDALHSAITNAAPAVNDGGAALKAAILAALALDPDWTARASTVTRGQ